MLWILTAIVSTTSSWIVLHKKINDGIIAKTLLSLSAISGSVFLLNPGNANAFVGTWALFAIGFSYLLFRKVVIISGQQKEHRRPF